MSTEYERLRLKLEAERAELLETIGHYEVLARNKKPGLGNHMADDGTEAFDQAASLSLHLNEQFLLDQVERALVRLDKGTYGVCERCGEPIGLARLEALPYATLCIRCQTHAETPHANGVKR